MGRSQHVRAMSWRARRSTLALPLFVSILFALGCGDSGGGGQGDAAADQRIDVAERDAAIDGADPLPDSKPLVECDPLTCDGLCGPVFDRCTGNTLECGGCTKTAQGEGCDPETETCICDPGVHKCTQVLLECNDFTPPFECGEIRNSCGQVRHCGYCPAGQECDPLTNTCTACTVECPDGKCSEEACLNFGIECNVETFTVDGVEQSGLVWLGCGDEVRDVVDCGNPCPEQGEICNPFFNTCEPDCEAPQGEEAIGAFCEAARAECGFISDGCGGRVDCGGDAECACGRDGRPNKCATVGRPVECASLGWECGTITEPICSNTPLDCGQCDTENGEVCRDNHTCGPACDVQTCADYLEQGRCGVQLDDGCGRVLAERCACPSSQSCDTEQAGEVGTCVDDPDCESLGLGGPGQRCSAGKVFEREGLEAIACPCAEGACLGEDGNPVGSDQIGCCTMCSGTDGPCAPDNTCLGELEQCCTGELFCNETTDTCEQEKTCQDYTTGILDQVCSTVENANFPVGDGSNLQCECRSDAPYKNLACRNGGDTLEGPTGTCECTEREVCEVGAKFDCRRHNLWDGCGSRLDCSCQQGFVCMSASGDCCELPTCPPTPFGAGQACTLSGCDRNETCPCVAGHTCHDGTCCKLPTCPSSPFAKGETCVVSACGTEERCNCESGTYCSGRTDTCCTDLPACGARKEDGERRRFSNECNDSKNCRCASGTHGSGDFCCRNLCSSAIPLGEPCGVVDRNVCDEEKTCTNCASGGTCYQGRCCDRRCTLGNVPEGGTCVQSKCGIANVCGSVCQVGVCYQGKCCDDRCVPRDNVPVGQPCKRQQTTCGKTRTCTDTCVDGATCYQDTCCQLPTLPADPADPGEVCRKSTCGQTATRECATPANAQPGAFSCGGDPALGSDKCGCVAERCRDELGNKICQPYTDRCGRFISNCTC